MATSLTEILITLQQAVQAVNNLATQISVTFPQVSALSTSATVVAGISYNSSQPTAFLSVISSSGATYKVPLFNP